MKRAGLRGVRREQNCRSTRSIKIRIETINNDELYGDFEKVEVLDPLK